jgi:Baseplate J-like protein
MSVNKREPNLELLLRGEVLALSSLDYASQRQAMLEALHDVLRGRYGQRDGTDPGIALIEALAAGLDVLGLYHDRFLTESKLGSAVRIQSVAWLAEAVGHVPSPRLAARALQFLEAKSEAILPSGARVGGKRLDVPGNVVFETTRSLSIGPAFNHMRMSPLVNRHAGASRVVIELTTAPAPYTLADLEGIDSRLKTVFDRLNLAAEAGPPTPRDDFQPGFLAMANGLFGLELARVEEARSRSIALQRGLRASYDPATTFLHAATQVRHLRNWRPLGSWPDGALPGSSEGPELMVFELAEQPILHYPAATVPGGLRSSLEVFVFEGADDPGLPSSWSREDVWTEVPDFSASEASDRHYRTFVDDRLHTYLILRRRLGYRVLLSDEALCRVFVQYTPAIGAIESWQDSDGLAQYPTFKLDNEYFQSGLVCPALKDGETTTKVECDGRVLTWAVTAEPLGLGADDQILIKDTETDRIFIRTLRGVRGRYIDWAGPAPTLPEPDRTEPRYGHGLWDLNHWFGGHRPQLRSELASPSGEALKLMQLLGEHYIVSADFEVKSGRGALASLEKSQRTNRHQQYDSLDGCFTPKKTELMPLRAAADGQDYPLWEEFYNRVEVPELNWREPDDWRPSPPHGLSSLRGTTIVPKGSIFLFLKDTSLVKPGDFFLIGTRIAAQFRRTPEEPGGGEALDPPFFDLNAPWIKAEVVQAQEVHGRIVRLRYPTANEYRADFQIDLADGSTLPQVAAQVLAVPLVASVYYGDRFTQAVPFNPDVGSSYAQGCRSVVLEGPRIIPGALRAVYGWDPAEREDAFNNLFLAVAGESQETGGAWAVVVEQLASLVRGHVSGFVNKNSALVGVRDFIGIQHDIVLEMDELWNSVDSEGQLELHAELYHDAEWSGNQLDVSPAPPGSLWLELAAVAPRLLDAGHRLTLEGETNAQVVAANYEASRYHLAGPGLDSREVTSLGVRWTVTSPGMEWTKSLASRASVRQVHQFHLETIEIEGEEEDEVQTEIRLTITNDSLSVGAEIQVLESDPREVLGILTVTEEKGRNRYYVVEYSGEHVEDLARAEALVWGIAGVWSSSDGSLQVSKKGEGLTFAGRPFFGLGYQPLAVEVAVEVDIRQFDPEDGYRVDDPGFSVTRVRARGLRWTNRVDPGSDPPANDDFGLDERFGEVRLTVRTYDLGPGDQLELRFAEGSPKSATVVDDKGNKGYYVLQYSGDVSGVIEIILRRVRIRSDFRIRLELPDELAEHEPWVLTFEKSAPLATSTLLYSGNHENSSSIEINFQPGKTALLLARYKAAGLTVPEPIVHVHENKKGELCRDAYASGPFPAFGEQDRNFLTSPALLGIEILLVEKGSEVFPVVTRETRSTLICDRRRIPGSPDGLATAAFVVGNGLNVYTQSLVFDSGNFIPVFSTQSQTNNVDFSLHLTVDGTELTFAPRLEDIDLTREQYVYNVNKTPEGVFTINVLINKFGEPPSEVKVEVEYAAVKLRDVKQDSEKIYEFETEVLPWNPLTQLVLVDSGDLEAGDYLFLRTGAPDESLPIQWTRVQSIHGRVVSVEPALFFQPRAARRYSLHGLAKVPRPQTLDPAYYKLLSAAVFEQSLSTSYSLPLGDQLPLAPLENKTLLASLIPGDHLLIWDERRRDAWRNFRVQSGGQPDTGDWFDWPDYQHEAIVKSVDAAIGLVVLEEPLPARFQIVYDDTTEQGSQTSTLCPRPADYQSLRVLPYYRAPFQGARELVAIGSGNHAKKFPRYVTEMASAIGLGSVPLGVDGTLASNVEVLARDPRSEEWSRWTQFQTIETAKSGDAAFTLGVELSGEQSKTVALSVSFGDGRKGALLPTGADNVYIRTTDVGRWHEHLQVRRELEILHMQFACAPFATPDAGAVRPNLWLLVEFGGHAHWRPTNDSRSWRPAMTVQLTPRTADELSGASHAREITFREITCEEARGGHDGIWVSSYRPGVVQVFFFSQETLFPVPANMEIKLWAEPQSRVWSLDGAFYDAVANPERAPSPASSAQIALLETRGLRAGSLLAFDRDDGGDFELATVEEVQHDTYSATLVSPLERAYPITKSALRGNLVYVEEGEREKLHIGSGDGRTANMRIPLSLRKPVMYSLDGSSSDPVPGVEILVDGVAWERRDDLGDAGPRDRVYGLDRDPTGGLTVEFGDGRNGAIPSRGTDNIEAIVRFGSDQPANVDAGVINKLRDGNLAVGRTWNLLAAAGGRLAESPSEARDRLRQRGLPYSRAITAEDLARLALEVGEVIHACVDPTADPTGGRRLVRVVVALDRRRQPDPTILGEIHRRLQPHLPVTAGTTIEVIGSEQRPVHIVVSDITVGAGYREGEVLAALNKAFAADGGGFFAPQHWSIGRALRLGDLYEAIFAVPGVSTARVRWMSVEKPPLDLRNATSETVEAGPRGVIRCDHDPDDHHLARGSLRFDLGGGRS